MFGIFPMFFWLSSAMGGSLPEHGINSSRVVPGNKVTSDEVAVRMSRVKTVSMGEVSGPLSEVFKTAAIASINDPHQGSYQTSVQEKASKECKMDQLILRRKPLDPGIDRHPDEGFGVVDVRGETAPGNSPQYSGVQLPILALESGHGDASLTATVHLERKPDRHYQETRTKKKRHKNGKVVRNKDGKPVMVKYNVDCTKRVVKVEVTSTLSQDGTKIMSSTTSGKRSDKQCGKERMKKIKSVNALIGPIVRSAGSKWGGHIQPQMETVRLDFFPTGTTALGIAHFMDNHHTSGMCLLDDALDRNSADHPAQYNKATILEAYGLYQDAQRLYGEAQAGPALQQKRWSKGVARTKARAAEIARLKTAYGMSAKETHFPYAESCPETDTEGTLPITSRVNLHATKKGEVIRKLHVDEPLRIIHVDKKWAQVKQLDGSEGWIKKKRAYKAR